jgi:hypothetical protein
VRKIVQKGVKVHSKRSVRLAINILLCPVANRIEQIKENKRWKKLLKRR